MTDTIPIASTVFQEQAPLMQRINSDRNATQLKLEVSHINRELMAHKTKFWNAK